MMRAARSGRRCLAIVVLLAASTVSAHAQAIGISEPIVPSITRLVAGLFICCLIAIMAALLLKRALHGGVALPRSWSFMRSLAVPDLRQLTVLETRRLSPHADVCRLASQGREYLLVVSPSGVTLLSSDAATPTDAAPE